MVWPSLAQPAVARKGVCLVGPRLRDALSWPKAPVDKVEGGQAHELDGGLKRTGE